MDLSSYRKLLEQTYEVDSEGIVANSGKEHAAELMGFLFKKSKQSVNMTVGKFSGDVSDQPVYLEAVKDALKRGVKFQILILEDVNLESMVLKEFENHVSSGQVTIYEYAKTVDNKPPVHWAVFDNENFRLEREPKSFGAVGGFHNKTIAEKLNKAFEISLQNAEVFVRK